MRRWSLELFVRQTNYSLRKMGHHQKHNRQTCPAKDARCHNCSKQGHFAKCCRGNSRVNMVSEVELAETSSSDYKASLGKSSANKHKPWTADIIVSQDCVRFKLDSGAKVRVLPPSTYSKLTYKPLLSKNQKKLYEPCRYDLRCRGEFQVILKYRPKTWTTTIYAMDDFNGLLLGTIEGIFKYQIERVVGYDVGMRETGRLFDQQNVSH